MPVLLQDQEYEELVKMKEWWKQNVKNSGNRPMTQPNPTPGGAPPRRRRRVRKARHKGRNKQKNSSAGNPSYNSMQPKRFAPETESSVDNIRLRQIEYRKAFLNRKRNRFYSEDIYETRSDSDEDMSDISVPTGRGGGYAQEKLLKWRTKAVARKLSADPNFDAGPVADIDIDPSVQDFVRNAIMHAQNGGKITVDRNRGNGRVPGGAKTARNNGVGDGFLPGYDGVDMGGDRRKRRKSWDDLTIVEQIEQLKQAARREALIAQARLTEAKEKQQMLHQLSTSGNNQLVEQALSRMMKSTRKNDATFRRLNNLVMSEPGESNGRTRRNSMGEIFE